MRNRTLTYVVLVLLLLAATSASQACPNCKEALASSGPNGANLVRGYFWSILFMMSMPFLILGGLSAYMYSLVRRARREQAETPQADAWVQQLTTS